MWKNESEDVKKTYLDTYEKNKKLYDEEMEKYIKEHGKPEKRRKDKKKKKEERELRKANK